MLHKLTLIPLTPIHIGSGGSIEPYEYVITDGFYKFHTERFLTMLNKDDQEEFLRLSLKDISTMRKFVREKIRIIQEIKEYSTDVSPRAIEVYEQRLQNPKSDLTVYPFIRSRNAPYIPGSSLKGAIRTALLYEKVKKPVTERNARKLEAETFGYARYIEGVYKGFDITRDPLKSLKISDSQNVDSPAILRIVTVYTKGTKGWREDIPMLREVTTSLLYDNSSVSFVHTLQIVEESPKLKRAFPNSTRDIVRACKNFYSLHLEEEKKYLASFPDAHKWYQELQNRENSLSEDAFLVRIGWGSGFDGVTINYAKAYRETKRSRRLSEGGVPLGWAEVKIQS